MKRETASGIVLTLLIGSMLFSATGFVKAQTDVHDLEASFSPAVISGTHSHVSHGNSAVLNATVTNRGNVSESNVVIELLINDTLSLSAVTPTLGVNSTFWTAYYWSPQDGDYNLTVYTPHVAGETNNNVTWWVRVCLDLPPIANFTATWLPSTSAPGPVSSYSVVTFNATIASDPVNQPDWSNVTYYAWNFGDGTPNGTGPVTTHNYTKPGNMTVTLTVSDVENLNDSTSQNITVYAFPVAYFNPPIGNYYAHEYLYFDASGSHDPDDTGPPPSGIATYTWDFGDNSSLYVTNQFFCYYKFATNNTFTVNLVVTDYEGLESASYSRNIVIGSDIPTASFNITSPPQSPYYVNENLTFDASSSIPDGHNISTYYWDWNDSTPPISTNASVCYHNFTQPNTYNVTLTVTDTNNKTSQPAFKSVIVKPQVSLQVTNSSGGNVITVNPGGNFNISVTIINVEDLNSFEFTLKYPGGYPGDYPAPLLKADLPKEVDFHLNSTLSQSAGTIRVVDTGPMHGTNGNRTLAIIPFYVMNPGRSTLYLLSGWTILNSTGFNTRATATQADFYTTKPVANFTYLPSNPPPGVNSTITFDASNSYCPDGGAIASYIWDFGDGNSGAGKTTTHNYTSPGTFLVNLTVTDSKSGETWSIVENVAVVAGRNVDVIEITLSELQFNESGTGMYETAGDLPINVTVINNEYAVSVTFNVTIYFNETAMKTQLVTLSPGENQTKVFNGFNISKMKGIYVIRVDLSNLESTENWTRHYPSGDLVSVYLVGDINRDGSTDLYDAILLAAAFGSTPHTAPAARPDLNSDGVIDLYDAIILAGNIGKTDP